MDIRVDQKQITSDERREINTQLKSELIDHLYEGCLPGAFSGVAGSLAIYFDFRGFSPPDLLFNWWLCFNAMLVVLTALFIGYKHFRALAPLAAWERAYSYVMCGCACMWLPCFYLMPDNLTRQFVCLIGLFLVIPGYATGTIGQFRLCVATVTITAAPLIVWCLLKGGIFYNIIAAYSLIYYIFMLGTNHRSTMWFIASLKLKLENSLVSYQVNHDMLTGLPNQRMLPQLLDAALAQSTSTNQPFAIVSFSPNRMEMINDSFGHDAGDSVIQSVANRLAMFIANSDNPSQYNLTISRKDTFNILITPYSDDELETKIKILFTVLDEPFYLARQGVKLTASMGVTIAPKDGQDPAVLVANADAAMLKAKQFGGNCLEFYRSEINAQMPKQLELETDLYEALKKNQLLLNYQPLVNLKTGMISNMEALLRWRHPKYGLISPLSFIPLAEETGLIVPIGKWVIEEACRQTKKWHLMGYPLKVAVNLAEKQLRQPDFIAMLDQILAENEFDLKYLELEITETAILDESIVHLIKEFKAKGLSLSVDDFGTGYSGLSYLKRFSINKLKIDQSFIRDIPGNADSITIVSAIIAMAKELHVDIVAEGCETLEQLQFLQGKGCDYIQGYYFSKPLDPDLFTALLIKSQKGLLVPSSVESDKLSRSVSTEEKLK